MRLLAVLFSVAVIGSVFHPVQTSFHHANLEVLETDSAPSDDDPAPTDDASALSDDACPSRRRFLATVEGGESPVLVRKMEQVDLICRPAVEAGCRWTSNNSNIIAEGCLLTSSGPGVFRCLQGDQLIGSVELKVSNYDQVYPYRDLRHRHPSTYSYKEERERLRSAYMCSDTGKLIERRLLCDRTRDCDNGEDEEGCGLSCDPPSAVSGSPLTVPKQQLYSHGTSVNYTCPPGLGFRETLDEYQRTCHEGLWSGSPAVCYRNLAFGRPSTASGRTGPGHGPEKAVDGQTSTWTFLAPSEGAQWLNVSLVPNGSVDLVLVRTPNTDYQVSLQSEGSRTACECNKSVYPELIGVCVCPATSTAINSSDVSLIVEIPSSEAAHLSLAVAEIVAFEAPSPASDECALLDQPAYGRFETVGSEVRLVCEAGYRASCSGVLPCGAATAAVCRPVTCPPPPSIPRTRIVSSNGTGWSAVTEYRCAAGYRQYPPPQRTTSVCEDGLWSLSHLSCLPQWDVRVVALQMGQQQARSVAALRDNLKTLLEEQMKVLHQLGQIQRRLQRVEQRLNIISEKLELEETEHEETEDEEERDGGMPEEVFRGLFVKE